MPDTVSATALPIRQASTGHGAARRLLLHYGPPVLVFLAVAAIWEAAVRGFHVPPFLLPAPSAILQRIVQDHSMLADNLRVTMEAACTGLSIGSLIALALAVLFMLSRLMERALLPWAIVIQTVPILAIAPLLTIWLGFGLAPKIAVAALITIFPVLVNTVRGLKSVNRQLFELMRIIGASPWDTFAQVRVFATLPYTFAGLRISAGGAVIGAIVAEFTGANRGIGTVIVNAGYRQDATMLFSAIVCSCAATVLLFYGVVAVERLCLFWPDARLDG